MLVRTILWGVW